MAHAQLLADLAPAHPADLEAMRAELLAARALGAAGPQPP
jgi:hypothetical protein